MMFVNRERYAMVNMGVTPTHRNFFVSVWKINREFNTKSTRTIRIDVNDFL